MLQCAIIDHADILNLGLSLIEICAMKGVPVKLTKSFDGTEILVFNQIDYIMETYTDPSKRSVIIAWKKKDENL